MVRVIFDPSQTSYKKLLDAFWDSHNPTQLNRQGNDVGTQYRSVIFYHSEEQKQLALKTKEKFNQRLVDKGLGSIASQILPALENPFYFAEEYHQQYLAKNPGGYCGLRSLNCYDPEDVKA